MRLAFLATHPWCQIDGCRHLATDIHHVQSIEDAPERRLDPDNLMSLCHAHHSAITAREQSGWGGDAA